MIILEQGTTLKAKLSGSVTDNELDIIVHHSILLNGRPVTANQNMVLESKTNGTSDVVICSEVETNATAGRWQRIVSSISIFNNDTAAAEVEIAYVKGSRYIINRSTVNAGDILYYEDGSGWGVVDSKGGKKTSSSETPSILILGETPTGDINGSNATFYSLNNFVPEKLEVFLNGVKQQLSDDYNTSGSTQINMFTSPLTNDKLKINYIKQ